MCVIYCIVSETFFLHILFHFQMKILISNLVTKLFKEVKSILINAHIKLWDSQLTLVT